MDNNVYRKDEIAYYQQCADVNCVIYTQKNFIKLKSLRRRQTSLCFLSEIIVIQYENIITTKHSLTSSPRGTNTMNHTMNIRITVNERAVDQTV